jgi:NAD+ synthase (glutamine-hydrolysing)
MAGGFDVLKDVYKTQVYALALYRNSLSPVIPLRVLTRPPSAELKAGQTDQDTLPPYEMLDAILNGVIEQKLDEEDLVSRGFDRQTVRFVLQKVWQSEYKRHQSAIGTKVSSCALGKDWRMPLTKALRAL